MKVFTFQENIKMIIEIKEITVTDMIEGMKETDQEKTIGQTEKGEDLVLMNEIIEIVKDNIFQI